MVKRLSEDTTQTENDKNPSVRAVRKNSLRDQSKILCSFLACSQNEVVHSGRRTLHVHTAQ